MEELFSFIFFCVCVMITVIPSLAVDADDSSAAVLRGNVNE